MTARCIQRQVGISSPPSLLSAHCGYPYRLLATFARASTLLKAVRPRSYPCNPHKTRRVFVPPYFLAQSSKR